MKGFTPFSRISYRQRKNTFEKEVDIMKKVLSLAVAVTMVLMVPATAFAHGHGGGHGRCRSTVSYPHYTNCNVENCTYTGIHEHNGVNYCSYAGEGHAYCGSGCYNY